MKKKWGCFNGKKHKWATHIPATGLMYAYESCVVCGQKKIAYDQAGKAKEEQSVPKVLRQSVPDWLLQKTFRIEYNPGCLSPFLVRLVGKGRGRIDGLPYMGIGKGIQRTETEELMAVDHPKFTQDALGFGKTLMVAAEEARKALEKQDD